MDTSAVIATLRACNEAQLRDVGAATGVPLPTLAKIRYGVTEDPRSSTIDKLRAHFLATREAAHRAAPLAAPDAQPQARVA